MLASRHILLSGSLISVICCNAYLGNQLTHCGNPPFLGTEYTFPFLSQYRSARDLPVFSFFTSSEQIFSLLIQILPRLFFSLINCDGTVRMYFLI